MRKKTLYFHHNLSFFAILILILVLMLVFLFIEIVGTAFKEIGFTPAMIALILLSSFAGSFINIPLLRLKATIPIVREEFVTFFGIVYRIPRVEYGETRTLLAINLGGALIPTSVSFYLLWKMPSAIIYALIGVAIVALLMLRQDL